MQTQREINIAENFLYSMDSGSMIKYSNHIFLSKESLASSSRLNGHFRTILFHFVPVFVSFTNNFNAGVHENLFLVLFLLLLKEGKTTEV